MVYACIARKCSQCKRKKSRWSVLADSFRERKDTMLVSVDVEWARHDPYFPCCACVTTQPNNNNLPLELSKNDSFETKNPCHFVPNVMVSAGFRSKPRSRVSAENQKASVTKIEQSLEPRVNMNVTVTT